MLGENPKMWGLVPARIADLPWSKGGLSLGGQSTPQAGNVKRGEPAAVSASMCNPDDGSAAAHGGHG